MLDEMGFAPPQYVKGRASIADLFKPNERCGIYVLHFSNGEFYAGQAIDVTRRYVQHCNSHKDIEKISFKAIRQNHLDEEERSVIRRLEKSGWLLRNVIFTSLPKGESDFDFIMSPEKQIEWLDNPFIIDGQGERLVAPDLRRKLRRYYERYLQAPHADRVLEILKTYIAAGIPAIRRGEVSFWCLSCMPKRNVYARVNVYWQEVFTAFVHKNELWFSLHLARSPLEKAFGADLSLLFERHPTADCIDHQYEPGGPDQTSFEIPAETVKAFISDPSVITAIRLLNLRLMKKGPCVYGRSHCLDLADKIIEVM